jgi:hypothetical protein
MGDNPSDDLDALQEIYVKAQLALHLDDELNTVNRMSRIRDKLALAGEKLREAGDQIEQRTDALLGRLANDLPGKVNQAFAPAEAVLTDYETGLDDLEKDLRLLSNAPLSDSESASKSSGAENPTKPQS